MEFFPLLENTISNFERKVIKIANWTKTLNHMYKSKTDFPDPSWDNPNLVSDESTDSFPHLSALVRINCFYETAFNWTKSAFSNHFLAQNFDEVFHLKNFESQNPMIFFPWWSSFPNPLVFWLLHSSILSQTMPFPVKPSLHSQLKDPSLLEIFNKNQK